MEVHPLSRQTELIIAGICAFLAIPVFLTLAYFFLSECFVSILSNPQKSLKLKHQANQKQVTIRIRSLNESEANSLIFSNVSCSICLSEFNTEVEISETICNHFFESPCLYKWLEQSENCPLCRTILIEDQ